MKENKINSDIHICINTKEEIKHITLLYGDPDRKLPKGISVLDIVKDCLTEDEYKEYEELFTTYVKTKPFTNEIKRKIQVLENRKFEMIVNIDNELISIGSLNFHGTHFSKAFDFDNNGSIVTGCIGIGLERWVNSINLKK